MRTNVVAIVAGIFCIGLTLLVSPLYIPQTTQANIPPTEVTYEEDDFIMSVTYFGAFFEGSDIANRGRNITVIHDSDTGVLVRNYPSRPSVVPDPTTYIQIQSFWNTSGTERYWKRSLVNRNGKLSGEFNVRNESCTTRDGSVRYNTDRDYSDWASQTESFDEERWVLEITEFETTTEGKRVVYTPQEGIHGFRGTDGRYGGILRVDETSGRIVTVNQSLVSANVSMRGEFWDVNSITTRGTTVPYIAVGEDGLLPLSFVQEFDFEKETRSQTITPPPWVENKTVRSVPFCE